MKCFLNLVALCTVVAFAGCSTTKTNTVAPGAVGEKNACCADKAACCPDKAKSDTSMGAVGDKATCTKTCPMTGKTETVSPGAVGENGCSKSKSSCADKAAEAVSPGAVSEKSGCCKSKAACTGTKIDG